jgi:hypothetical protein
MEVNAGNIIAGLALLLSGYATWKEAVPSIVES